MVTALTGSVVVGWSGGNNVGSVAATATTSYGDGDRDNNTRLSSNIDHGGNGVGTIGRCYIHGWQKPGDLGFRGQRGYLEVKSGLLLYGLLVCSLLVRLTCIENPEVTSGLLVYGLLV